MRAPRLLERVVERPPRRAARDGRRAQAQRRDALERLRQPLADLADQVGGGHLDILELELPVKAAVQRANLARDRDARRLALHDEHGRARLAAGIVRHLRHRQQQVGVGAAGHERLDARDNERVAPSHRRGAGSLARVGEGKGRGQLAAQHRQEEALALRARGHTQEPTVAAQDEAAQRALGARDLLVERRQCHGPEAAAAQLGRLGEPVEAELGRARSRPTPECRTRLRVVGKALLHGSGLQLFLDKSAQALAKRDDLGRQGDRVHRRARQRARAASSPSAMQANATLAAVGTPNRAVCRAGRPFGKCVTYSALISW